jgi:hypothetical protein
MAEAAEARHVDLAARLEELRMYYLEVVEATPTRYLDDDMARASAKLSAYRVFTEQLKAILEGSEVHYERYD